MKTKFSSGDNLSIHIKIKLSNLTILVRSVFQEDKKYTQVFFRRVYEL